MTPNRRVFPIVVHTFFCSLLGTFTATISTETDITCLKSVKSSLEDPFDYLASWEFTNNTEGYLCKFAGVECWHSDENRVMNLRLSDMGLRGQFPRGIRNCTSLTGLDISNNELQGPIPLDIDMIVGFLTSLDLSSNTFFGEIPIGIANCSYLNVLKLDHNRLTGQIPPQIGLLNRIKVFSVANNMLSGPVPPFINPTFSADSYANNIALCGKPLESCEESARNSGSFKDGFVIGYVVFVVIVVAAYGSYCTPCIHVGKRNKMITVAALLKLMLQRRNKKTEVDLQESSSTMWFLLENQVSTSERFVTRMNFMDLCNATENFSQHSIIGSGQMRTLYKATLLNGWSVAVKRLSNPLDMEERFMSELKTLGRFRHDNLLPLIGFCIEPNEWFLVYASISNGNLFDWLHSMDGKKKILQWPLRVKIAAGLARGLAWLHHGCNFRVAHLNISSKCVLLDQSFEPQLSNFEMAVLINLNETNLCRNFSMDIEFLDHCFIKEDVFNFGIVLLELITGKMANSADASLDKWMSEFCCGSASFYDAVDTILIGRGDDDEIFQLLSVACHCVQPLPEQRPSMLEVLRTISAIREKYEVREQNTGGFSSGDEKVELEIREIQ